MHQGGGRCDSRMGCKMLVFPEPFIPVKIIKSCANPVSESGKSNSLFLIFLNFSIITLDILILQYVADIT